MLNNPVFIEFTKKVAADGIDPSQIVKLSDAQTTEIAGTKEKLSANFIANMKSLAAEQSAKQQDAATAVQIVKALSDVFPAVQVQIVRDGTRRIANLQLDGEIKDAL